jgi:hypothetical protein
MKSIGDLHGFLFIYEVSMVAMNKQVLEALTRHGYFRGRLRTGLDISPCDLKDWESGPYGFTCRGEDTIRDFLRGFSEADIARSARWSCLYAVYIKKGRFPEGEEAMRECKQTQHWWEYYSREIPLIESKSKKPKKPKKP